MRTDDTDKIRVQYTSIYYHTLNEADQTWQPAAVELRMYGKHYYYTAVPEVQGTIRNTTAVLMVTEHYLVPV